MKIKQITGPVRELKPFQREGVEFALRTFQERRTCFIGDDMGLGKTIQAIHVAYNLNAQKILYICPPSLKINTKMQILADFPQSEEDILIVDTSYQEITPRKWIIVGYSAATMPKIMDALSKMKFDLLIFDEAHYLKNPKSQRSRAFIVDRMVRGYNVYERSLKHNAKKILLLSGTPIKKNVIDIYTYLKNLASDKVLEFKSSIEFGKYFAYYSKQSFGGNSFLQFHGLRKEKEREIHKKLEGFMIRRLKKDVLKDLPPLTIIPLWLDPPNNQIKRTLESEEKWSWILNKRELSEKQKEHIITQRRVVGKSKVKILKDIIPYDEDDCEYIVMARFLDNIKEIEKECKDKFEIVTGKMDVNARAEIIQKYQDNKINKPLLCSMGAIAEGFTITRANRIFYLEVDYDQTLMAQSRDRIYRIGQENNVQIFYVLYNKGLDKSIYNTFINKQKTSDKVLAGAVR